MTYFLFVVLWQVSVRIILYYRLSSEHRFRSSGQRGKGTCVLRSLAEGSGQCSKVSQNDNHRIQGGALWWTIKELLLSRRTVSLSVLKSNPHWELLFSFIASCDTSGSKYCVPLQEAKGLLLSFTAINQYVWLKYRYVLHVSHGSVHFIPNLSV